MESRLVTAWTEHGELIWKDLESGGSITFAKTDGETHSGISSSHPLISANHPLTELNQEVIHMGAREPHLTAL